MSGTSAIFHNAFEVTDLGATRRFYGDLLGCPTGRRRDHPASVDFDFFGHHIVCHLAAGEAGDEVRSTNLASDLRHRHFGVILEWPAWEALAERLRGAGVEFLVEPQTRYVGEPQEEALLMLRDPSGNALEFKTFRDVRHLFGTA